ncbi:ScyD/ScyE family protein [Fodinibius salsisoli]|uniref:ScyD/ScyE family protein n=1 Tax=Fodinibius salsisoli TaxID=2820877 RepID=A0ABT3PR64_9BACT|nr:ScyD/ScyE family protein [Fodinibius salsisoli]MCW9708344.1 ScyD/ScyE family protein [Fodinibius salsisoli]
MKRISPFVENRRCVGVKRCGYWLMAASILLLAVACDQTDINSAKDVEPVSSYENSELAYEANHPLILSDSKIYRKWDYSGKSSAFKKSDEVTFASPLFGLTTSPNGDIFVADAGFGVVSTTGGTEIMLPGVTDMSPLGQSSMWALEGLSGAPEEDTGQGLYRLSKGQTRLIVDLYDFEAENNPDGGAIDSNPFDVQSLGGQSALVADPGANALLKVSNQGHVKVLAVFPNELVSTENIKNLEECPSESPLCGLPPNIPAQPVPTSVAIGPDGYYYVGELKGFPAPTGASNIWRVSPDASEAVCGSSPDCVKVFDGGFTSIIDLAFDENGILHVAELDELSWFAVEVLGPGAIAGGTINACDLSSLNCSEVATGIPILTAITFGKDGVLWATQNALIPGAAEVIAIE